MPCLRQTSTTLSPDSASRKTRRISSSLCPRFAILQFSSSFQRTTTDHFLSTSKWLSFWVLGQVRKVGSSLTKTRLSVDLHSSSVDTLDTDASPHDIEHSSSCEVFGLASALLFYGM